MNGAEKSARERGKLTDAKRVAMGSHDIKYTTPRHPNQDRITREKPSDAIAQRLRLIEETKNNVFLSEKDKKRLIDACESAIMTLRARQEAEERKHVG